MDSIQMCQTASSQKNLEYDVEDVCIVSENSDLQYQAKSTQSKQNFFKLKKRKIYQDKNVQKNLPALETPSVNESIDYEDIECITKVEDLIIFEFKIEGMTCVACSSSIERGMKNQFKDKGLKYDTVKQDYDVNVILLMNKMKITFEKHIMVKESITQETIIEEIENLGFGAEHIQTHEICLNHSQSSMIEQQVIKISNFSIQGMTCSSCSGSIENHFNQMIKNKKGIFEISVNLLLNKATVRYDPNVIGPRSIIEEIDDLGFQADLILPNKSLDIKEISMKEFKNQKLKLIICVSLYLPLAILIWIVPYVESLKEFVISFQVWNGNTAYIYIIFIFASIIQFSVGLQFYKSGFKSLKNKSANMDVLIVLGTTASWMYGFIQLFTGHTSDFSNIQDQKQKDMMQDEYRMEIHSHSHNFETSSILILIVTLGKFIEIFSKMKTINKLQELAELKVTKANLISEKDKNKISLNSASKEIEVELLQLYDYVFVQPGSGIPTDGTVMFGRCSCDESMLTGESLPVSKDLGSQVFGGTNIVQGSVIMRVDKLVEDATYNQLLRLVENTQNTKAPIQGVADKISSIFVPFIIFLAAITWIFWFSYVYASEGSANVCRDNQQYSKFQFAFDFGISTLVIACPCALGLATPTAVMVGTGLAASFGILIKNAEILQKIEKINVVVFDKTGTLTSGNPEVKDLINVHTVFNVKEANSDDLFLYKILYNAEKNSEHPIAQSICKHILNFLQNAETSKEIKVLNFQNKSGEGLISTMEIHQSNNQTDEIGVLCGNIKLMNNYKVLEKYPDLLNNVNLLEEQGKTVIILAINQVPQLILSLEETHTSKPESQLVVKYLQKELGMKVYMITGDNKHSALRVAKHVGIHPDNVTFEAYPETKKNIVENLQNQGNFVIFVGDGINDSPVLAQSDVGCSINSGSNITVEAAGIVLMKDELMDLIKAILISKKTFQRIKINFVFAFLYNVILIPVAMGVLLSIDCSLKMDPKYAAIAMAMSSISVVSSSLFLKLYNPNSALQNYN